MSCSPENAKNFTLRLQAYVANLLKKEFPSRPLNECLDIANDIVEYSFSMMLTTHTGETIFEDEDDIPF